MFICGILIGTMIGAFITLMLYACIIVGKQAEEKIQKYEK